MNQQIREKKKHSKQINKMTINQTSCRNSLKSDLRDPLSTHQDNEDCSQKDAKTNQHERNVHNDLLLLNDLMQLQG